MKFLCVKCDAPMNLTETSGPDEGGSLAVVFQCSACLHEVAMLTNAHETQMVSSLGVKIGPDGKETPSKCPFTATVRAATGSQEQESAPDEPMSGMAWTAGALQRLENIPEFIRPMAKSGIESFAQSNGLTVINEEILDQAKGMFS